MSTKQARLTTKQEAFCREYLVDFNAAAAAVRAGYSASCAKEIGCENLTKPNVSAFLQNLLHERHKKLSLEAERVIREARRIAYSAITDVVSWKDGVLHVKDSSELTPDQQAAIRKIRVVTIGRTPDKAPIQQLTIEWHNKQPALDLLAKYEDLYAPTRIKIEMEEGFVRTVLDLVADEVREREVLLRLAERIDRLMSERNEMPRGRFDLPAASEN